MVKPPVKTPKKSASTHQPADTDPLFPRNTVVAIPGREAGLNFKLVKLLEDVFEESENVQVVYLKPWEDPFVLNCYYEDTIQGEISDKDIICRPELQESKIRIKGKGVRALYKLNRQGLNKVKSLAKNFEGILEDESEESEEESEEEEVALPARPVKKVARRKGATKKAEEEVEQEEGERKAELASKRGTRGAAKKTEEVTRSTKKQKVEGEKGKSTKNEEIDAEEEEEKEITKKDKKAVSRPNVEVIEHSEMLESEDNHVIDYGSTRANNKNIIRAVYTRNHELLEECLSKENFFSTFFEKWGVDTNFNAFQLALKQGDKKATQLLCKAAKNKSFKYAPHQKSSLSTLETDYKRISASKTRVQRVKKGRGDKEPNGPLTQDEVHRGLLDNDTITTIFETVKDLEIFNILSLGKYPMEFYFQRHIQTVFFAGNLILATEMEKILSRHWIAGFTEIHALALTADNPEVFENIWKGRCTAKTAPSLLTPIHFACINPNGKILEALLEKCPEYNLSDSLLRKPIHYAAACEGPEPLAFLLKKNVNYKVTDKNHETPLTIATRCGRAKNLELLLKQGDASILSHMTKDRMNALHLAVDKGHLEAVKVLVKYKANIESYGRQGMTALILAAAKGHFEIVQYLLDGGARINGKDRFKRNALILAVMNGNVKIASYLLKHGADLNQVDSSGNTPVHYAAAYGWMDCLDFLMKAGADKNQANSLQLTPLAVSFLKKNFGCLKKLLSCPSTDINCKDKNGRTLIISAIQTLNVTNAEQIRYLVQEKNADTNMTDLDGNTALHHLASLNIENIAKSSLGRSFPDETERKRQLEKAIEVFKALQFDVLQVLLESKADPNLQNHKGATPLVEALKIRNFTLCDALLNVPDINLAIVNKRDETLYHFLAPSIASEDGLNLFTKIADQLGNPDELLNKVDILGFTPILKFIKSFAQSINGVRNQLFEKLKERELDRKQKEWDEARQGKIMEQEKPLAKPFAKEPAKRIVEEDVEEEDDEPKSLTGGARTKQTAGNFIGGYAPRMRLGMMAVGKVAPYYGGPVGGFGFGGGYAVLDGRPVDLEQEEVTRLIKGEGEQQFEGIVDKFIQVLKKLVESGARLDDSIQKLRPYRNFKMTPEDLRQKILAAIIKKRKERQNQAEKILNRHLHPYSRHNQQHPKKIPTEYCPQGNQNALHLIQRFPHPKIIEFLLSSGAAPVNQQDYLKRTPLHFFVKYQNLQLTTKISSTRALELLLKHKANPNIPNIHQESPFFLTLQHQKTPFFEHLLKRSKPELNLLNSKGETPLIFSVKGRHLQSIQQLLKAGADPNIKGHRDRTALHYALNNSVSGADASFDVEELLIKHGARVNQVDSRGRTPLHYAFVKINDPFDVSRIDPVEVVTSYCSQDGCDFNVKDQWGCTPLHYAAQRGAQICAATLINSGANINAKDALGNMPLAIALRSDRPHLAIALLQKNASVDSEVHVVETDLVKIKKGEKEAENATKEAIEIESLGESEEDKETTANLEEDLNELEALENEKRQNFEEVEVDEDLPAEEPLGDSQDQYQPSFSERYNPWNFRDHYTLQDTSHLEVGSYSLFTVVLRKNQQGVAYLLLQNGYDFMRAIQDAFTQKKFNFVLTLLSKVEDKSVLLKANSSGQNLFHIFAIHGCSASTSLAAKIYNAFMARNIDYTLADSEGRTPLHYAAMHNFQYLFETLLQNGVDIDAPDAQGCTPFVLQLTSETGKLNDSNIQPYLDYKANLNVPFKAKEILTGPLNYLISHNHPNYKNLFKILVNNGASINELDGNGYTPLMHAIRANSISLVKYLLNYPDLDKTIRDKEGKTPIHHVVQPLDYGSFENEEMLEILAAHFDVNKADSSKKTPIYYAHLQDDGIMVQALRDLGAIDSKAASNLKRAATSVIASVDWPKEEVDYEEDTEKFMEKVEKEPIITEEKVRPDQYCQDANYYEVVFDDKFGAYDLFMTKVDVKKGFFSGNVFYKMQVLSHKLRDYYTVYTRYGGIGEPGQMQNTPYPDKESAIKEFGKIFKSKSGNEWAHKESFEKKPHKYQLLQFNRGVKHKENLVPFDLNNPKVPQTALDNEIKAIIHDIADVKMYQKTMQALNIDTELLSLSRLARGVLNEAQNLFFEISELLDQIDEERKNQNHSKVTEWSEKISEKSNRFYELIPDDRFRNSPVTSIFNKHILGEKSRVVDNLIDFEVSSKILLGALYKEFEVNPLDYCYQALSIKMISLQEEHPEYALIKKYIEAGSKPETSGFIKNIFALERKGEAERISQHKRLEDKMLLWHGCKLSSFMGILAQGLTL